jgi:hypothetical protein
VADVETLTDDIIAEMAPAADDYLQNVPNDDFVPLITELIDNGNVFRFAQDAATKLHQSTDGDIHVAQKSYFALIDTLRSTTRDANKTTYADDFKMLCDGVNVPEGCAALAFEVVGGDDREITTFAYQPGITPAYFNTIYNTREMFLLAKTPPTQLIETYYTCVLSHWDALYQSLGLASSNVQLFLTVFFMLYMYLLVLYHNNATAGTKIKYRVDKEAERDLKLKDVMDNFEALKLCMDALRLDCEIRDHQMTCLRTAHVIIRDNKIAASAEQQEATVAVEGAPLSVRSTLSPRKFMSFFSRNPSEKVMPMKTTADGDAQNGDTVSRIDDIEKQG